MDNNYISFESMGTTAGMIAAVTLLVQFLKLPLDKVWKIPTRFFVYGLALMLQIVYQVAFVKDYSFNTYFLSVINAVVVAVGAIGAYELTFAKTDK